MYSEDELLPLSGLQHLAFCERQWGLIHVEQIWVDSADTLRGDYFHERVDTAGYACADGVRADRQMRLVSLRLGLYGVADIVEVCTENPTSVTPVEYKVGRPKVEDWDRIQLTAQALCLEEMFGVSVTSGFLFYGKTRRREHVLITESLRERVDALTVRMHALYDAGETPPPIAGTRCRRCSLHDACMPELAAHDVAAYWSSYGETLEVTP